MLALAALLLLQDPTPPQAPALAPEVAALQAACRKLAQAASYTVTQSSTEEGGGFGGPPPAPPAEPGAAGAPPQPPQPPAPLVFTAQVQQGKPTHFQLRDLEAWRDQGVLVHRAAGGAWERQEMRGGRGTQGGGGQGAGQAGGGQGSGQGGDPEAARAMRTRMSLATTRMAHEIVEGFETKISGVTTAQEGGKTVLTGALTPEGAAGLSMGGFGRRGGRSGSGSGQGQGQGQGQGGPPPFESSGTFRAVIGGDGALESLTLDLLTKGSFNEQSFERKRHLELTISAVGTTALAVPEEVLKKFSEKPAEAVEF